MEYIPLWRAIGASIGAVFDGGEDCGFDIGQKDGEWTWASIVFIKGMPFINLGGLIP